MSDTINASAIATSAIATTTKPQFGELIDDAMFTQICVAHANNMRQHTIKNDGKVWMPRNGALNRAHFTYAQQNAQRMGMTTWGQVALEYPCVKISGRIAIFASGMDKTPLGDRNAITRLVKWIDNGGKHVEPPKKDEVVDGSGI